MAVIDALDKPVAETIARFIDALWAERGLSKATLDAYQADLARFAASEQCPSNGLLAVAPGGPPVRFQIGGQVYQVHRYWGPERIETGWWRGRSVRRDYYRVETTTGQRFWLFRGREDGRWYLQGMFE